MMKRQRNIPVLSIIMLTESSITIVLSPFTDYRTTGTVRSISVILSLCFWVGLLVGYISLFMFYRKKSKSDIQGKAGAVCFFRNIYAAITDIIMIADILLITILTLIEFRMALMYSSLLGILFLSIHLHCIFNGKIFNHSLKEKEEDKNE